MPIRVVVVDDEPLVRDGLGRAIDALPGFSLAGNADNGDDAIRLISSARPEICILDIKMPGSSGLDVLESVRATGNRTRCVILSGHDEFRYAQKAISLKADDYLLKPASEEKLKIVLQRLKAEIEAEHKSAGEEQTLRRRLRQGNEAIEERFYRGLITGAVSPDEVEAHERSVTTDGAAVRLVLVNFDDGYQLRLCAGDKERRQLLERARAVVRTESARRFETRVPVVIEGDDIAILLTADRYEVGYLNRIKSEIRRLVGRRVSIAAGDERPVTELADSYRVARERMRLRLVRGGYRLFLHDEDTDENDTISLPEPILDELKKSLRYSDRNGVVRTLNELVAFPTVHTVDPDGWRQFCFRVLEECHFLVREMVPSVDRRLPTIVASDALRAVSSPADLRLWLEEGIGRLLDVLESSAKSYSLAIKKALDYIDRRHRSAVTLTDLAEHVKLNPSYLSNLLRKETNATFVQHVTRRRIESAQQMLAAGEMNVSEIAYELGYENPRYFSEVFRKVTGRTPSEFRRQASTDLSKKT